MHRSNFTAEEILEEFEGCQPDVELAMARYCAYHIEHQKENAKLWRLLHPGKYWAAQARYLKSAKGKAVANRYKRSAKGKAATARARAKARAKLTIEKLAQRSAQTAAWKHKNKDKVRASKARSLQKRKMNPEQYALFRTRETLRNREWRKRSKK